MFDWSEMNTEVFLYSTLYCELNYHLYPVSHFKQKVRKGGWVLSQCMVKLIVRKILFKFR